MSSWVFIWISYAETFFNRIVKTYVHKWANIMDRILFNYLYKVVYQCLFRKCWHLMKFFKRMLFCCGFMKSIMFFHLFLWHMHSIRIGKRAHRLFKISKNYLKSRIFKFNAKLLSIRMTMLALSTLMMRPKFKK